MTFSYCKLSLVIMFCFACLCSLVFQSLLFFFFIVCFAACCCCVCGWLLHLPAPPYLAYHPAENSPPIAPRGLASAFATSTWSDTISSAFRGHHHSNSQHSSTSSRKPNNSNKHHSVHLNSPQQQQQQASSLHSNCSCVCTSATATGNNNITCTGNCTTSTACCNCCCGCSNNGSSSSSSHSHNSNINICSTNHNNGNNNYNLNGSNSASRATSVAEHSGIPKQCLNDPSSSAQLHPSVAGGGTTIAPTQAPMSSTQPTQSSVSGGGIKELVMTSLRNGGSNITKIAGGSSSGSNFAYNSLMVGRNSGLTTGSLRQHNRKSGTSSSFGRRTGLQRRNNSSASHNDVPLNSHSNNSRYNNSRSNNNSGKTGGTWQLGFSSIGSGSQSSRHHLNHSNHQQQATTLHSSYSVNRGLFSFSFVEPIPLVLFLWFSIGVVFFF